MRRCSEELADALEPVATDAPLDVDHASALEDARQNERGVASGVYAIELMLGEEPGEGPR